MSTPHYSLRPDPRLWHGAERMIAKQWEAAARSFAPAGTLAPLARRPLSTHTAPAPAPRRPRLLIAGTARSYATPLVCSDGRPRRIVPGAFHVSVVRRAAAALLDHDDERWIGSMAAGQLRVYETPSGLDFDLDVSAAPVEDRCRAITAAGGGVSIGVDWRKYCDDRDDRAGVIRYADLVEVSVLTRSAGADPTARCRIEWACPTCFLTDPTRPHYLTPAPSRGDFTCRHCRLRCPRL